MSVLFDISSDAIFRIFGKLIMSDGEIRKYELGKKYHLKPGEELVDTTIENKIKYSRRIGIISEQRMNNLVTLLEKVSKGKWKRDTKKYDLDGNTGKFDGYLDGKKIHIYKISNNAKYNTSPHAKKLYLALERYTGSAKMKF